MNAKNFVLLTCVAALVVTGCSKQLGKSITPNEQPQVAILVSPDPEDSTSNALPGNEGEPSDSTDEISQAEENKHSVYTFMGVSGTYFGCSSTFRTHKETLQFTFGTNLTRNVTFTQQEFEELIAPGERVYGSLGAFTSFPERNPGKVEIAFTDKNGRRWSSTHITENKKGDDIETTVKVEQHKAKFVIEDAHKFELSADTEGYRLRGKFECTLYEVNGKAKKKIKGTFAGVVAPN